MSEENPIKAERPVPALQPMRVVQVPEAPVTSVPNSVEAPKLTKSGKPVVMSKKEYEADKIKKTEHKAFVGVNLPPLTEEERNARSLSPRSIPVEATDFPNDWKTAGHKQVFRAWGQTPISISGVLSSETTFSAEKLTGAVMCWSNEDGGLLIRHKSIEYFIPEANVKCCVFKER